MAKEKKIDTIEKLAALVADSVADLKDELNQRLDHIQDDVQTIRYDVKDLKTDMAEVKAELKGHGRAIDKDALALINHERRIKKLEGVR